MDQKQFVSRINLILFVILNTVTVFAQPDCRSILGAHSKPLGSTGISWAAEGTIAGGIMNDRKIANGSLYVGTEYQFGKSNLYFEGAYKNWYNTAANPDGEDRDSSMVDYNKPTRYNWGFRELHYSFKNDDFYVKLGVQSIKSKDYLLLDERVFGVSAEKKLGAFTLNGNLGSVTQRIARFQDVCGNRHVYNIIHRSQYNFVGEKLGETNLGALHLTWKPTKKSSVGSSSKKELEEEEFGAFEEFSENEFSSDEFQKEETKFRVAETGMFFFEEFGMGFHEYKYYSGFFAAFNVFDFLELKSQVVDQFIYNDHALAYFLEAEKVINWIGGNSSQIQLGYLGKFDITESAHFYPAFTNLFLGEVMRMDAIDLPLSYASVKHMFTGKRKLSVEIKGVAQLKGSQSRELDCILDLKPFKNIRLSGIGSVMNSELLDSPYWMAKLELRIAI